MKKQLIAAAVSVGLAVTANAGSLQDSSAQSAASKDGSSTSLEGALGSVGATLSISVDGSTSAYNSAESAVSASAEAAGASVMYIWTTPSNDMSADSAEASRATGRFILDVSGNVYRAVGDSLTYVSTTPSNEMSADSAEASKNAIEITLTASGEVAEASKEIASASGEYVSGKYEAPIELVSNGSGQVFVASGASIVISKDSAVDASAATLTFIDETSIEASRVSAAESKALVLTFSAASGRVFDASKRGKLNEDK